MNSNKNRSFKTGLLSIVFSFRNEEYVLKELILRMRKVFDSLCREQRISTYEMIFVNDDSSDNSLQILMEEAKGHNDIKIITMSRRFGVSPCVLVGMEYALGEAVIYMDADLQDPPEVIPYIIRAWQNGDNIDVVHTVRDSREGESKVKLLLTKIGYKVLFFCTNIDLPIESGDFKLLSRRAVNHLVGLKEVKPFLRGLVCWIGFNHTYVHYKREARFSGKTKFPIFSNAVIWNFLESALISFSNIPLKISLLLGGIVAIFSFLFLIYVVIQKFILNYTTPGWSAIMVTILFLGGVQLITIGILGLYISSIYLETKRRPNYIIVSTFGFHKNS